MSNHQGDIDWPAVAGDNIDFAYIKATEGGDFVDDWFERNWDGARAAGLDVGAYHFFTLCRSGAEQAANFLAVVPADESDLPAALDSELAGNCSERPTTDWVHAEVTTWLDAVEQATGREVLLYVLPRFDDLYDITGTFDNRLWHRRILRRPGGDRWVVWTRTQVYLTGEQRRRIDALAEAEGVSMAEIIRRALDSYLDDEAPDPELALVATFGAAPDATVSDLVSTLLAPFREVPVDRRVAERAGRIRRESGIRLPDALIAATAIEHGLVLATRNRSDFEPVRSLRLREL